MEIVSNISAQSSLQKFKEWIFVSPQIRTMIKYKQFENSMTTAEKDGWNALKDMIEYFLGNNKHPDYTDLFNKMVAEFRDLGCNMNIKLYFLFSYLSEFPENLGTVSEDQGERFHQDIRETECRFQGSRVRQ